MDWLNGLFIAIAVLFVIIGLPCLVGFIIYIFSDGENDFLRRNIANDSDRG